MHRILPWILPAAALMGWGMASRLGWVPAYLLPSPGDTLDMARLYILGTPGQGPYAGRFAGDALASLGRVGLGFGLATVLGLTLGIWSGRVPAAARLLNTPVNGLRAVPGITWLPLAMVWFGIGLKTTVFLVALAAFFPIYLNAASGAAQVNPLLLQAGAMMGVDRVRGTFAILLPAAMPAITTGLRLGLGISWAYLVLGELSGVPDGLGAVIMDARMLGRIDMIVVGIIIIALMGQASDWLLKNGLKFCFKSAARQI
ncbi:MAG: ABC transporter permease [Desulfobacter sp.]|nr:MAG: ABC transporter permease [Desulfobacter sp.]